MKLEANLHETTPGRLLNCNSIKLQFNLSDIMGRTESQNVNIQLISRCRSREKLTIERIPLETYCQKTVCSCILHRRYTKKYELKNRLTR